MAQQIPQAASTGSRQPRSVLRLVGGCLVGCAVKAAADALVRATSGGEGR